MSPLLCLLMGEFCYRIPNNIKMSPSQRCIPSGGSQDGCPFSWLVFVPLNPSNLGRTRICGTFGRYIGLFADVLPGRRNEDQRTPGKEGRNSNLNLTAPVFFSPCKDKQYRNVVTCVCAAGSSVDLKICYDPFRRRRLFTVKDGS